MPLSWGVSLDINFFFLLIPHISVELNQKYMTIITVQNRANAAEKLIHNIKNKIEPSYWTDIVEIKFWVMTRTEGQIRC